MLVPISRKPTPLLLAFLFSAFFVPALAQQHAPSIIWQKALGGSGDEKAYSIVRSVTGGFTIAGSSTSNDGDVSGHHGTVGVTDAWVVSLAADGSIQWQRSLGGTAADELVYIINTVDGGTISIGNSSSADGDLTANHGMQDIWVVKMDRTGVVQWQKNYGGSFAETGRSIRQTSDGGYIFIGSTASNDGDVSGNHGTGTYPPTDIWVVKLDAAGAIQWQRCYGGSESDHGNDIMSISGGEYVLAVDGQTSGTPDDGDFYGHGGGNSPVSFLMKIGSAGELLQVQLTGDRSEVYGLQKVNDESFFSLRDLLNCYPMNPNSGFSTRQTDTSFNAVNNPADNFAYCPSLISPSVYGYKAIGPGSMIVLNSSSGVVAGATSDTAGLTNHGGFVDAFLGSFSPHSWGRCYGGSGEDRFQGIVALNDFSFVTAGYTTSNDGDVSGNHGGYDCWVVKLGNINNIRGAVYLDYNANGSKDASEPLVSDILVQSSGGSILSGSLTYNGLYNNAVDTGTYHTSVISTLPYYTAVPASHPTTFSSYNNADSFSFALQPVPGKRDYLINLYPLSFARLGFTSNYQLSYVNIGTDTLVNRTVMLIKDHRAQYISAIPAESSVSGDTIRWIIPHLSPRDTGVIAITMKLPVPPVMNPGDTLSSSAVIDTSGDLNPQNNYAALREGVRDSYDPNDKSEANEGTVYSADLAKGKYLQYTIRFQNTGNDTAFAVIVADTLSSKLDLSTFQMVKASNPYQLTVKNGNQLTWTFNNILLPDSNTNEPASHGYIVYRIQPKPTVAAGDSIGNTAAIYFDFNLPVATNRQSTFIVARSITAPPVPVLSGLDSNYCSNSAAQVISISNVPSAEQAVTLLAEVDGNPVPIGADGSITLSINSLSPGAHTVKVVFSNTAGADSLKTGFHVEAAAAPLVKLRSSAYAITDSTQQVILTATDSSGGGSNPLYTFARNSSFTDIVQAESPLSSVTLSAFSLTVGNNTFFVRMKTSDTCYTVPAARDSLVIVRSQPTGPIPGQSLLISPNPFDGQLTVAGLDAAKSYVISLINSNGREVIRKDVSGLQTTVLVTGELSRGIYLLFLYDAKDGHLIRSIKLLSARTP